MDIIYILTNEAMPDYIKIGKTGDLDARLKQLYSTNIPHPFKPFFACRVEDADKVEKALHYVFAKYRGAKKREFFKIDPNKVCAILELLSKENVTPKPSTEDEKKEEKAKERDSTFNFKLANIPSGSEIYFSRDESIKATVIDHKKIRYNGEETSLSAAAKKILGSTAARGPIYWMYEDEKHGAETLDERRKRIEEEE